MSSFQIKKLTPSIGAEIFGKNLFDNLTTTFCDKIYKTLIEHKVIFFRNQEITNDQHIKFAKNFGKIEPPHPVYPHVNEYPEIVLLENYENRPPDTDVWHTDVTFKPNPPFASILYSKIIPSSGGDTLWSCLSSIYDALPNDIKKYLETLKAVHDMGDFRNTFTKNESIGKAKKLNEGFKKFGSSIHPVIKIHPVTKKKIIYINPGFTSYIVGLNSTDSNNLLNYLFTFMNKPQFQIRFKWSEHTIAMWDNRCTMHYAIGDYMPYHRKMHRVTVLNDQRE
ncbi:TauD/TfdA family dioxygenase [Pelagibacteraceae bacterium]|nr:TauD/TfdA family dioxygenase [Pelagibacteraceae bacterium]